MFNLSTFLNNDFLLDLQSKLFKHNIKNEFYKISKVTIETMISKNIVMGNLFSKMNFLWIKIILILFEVQIKHCSGEFNPQDIRHNFSLLLLSCLPI